MPGTKHKGESRDSETGKGKRPPEEPHRTTSGSSLWRVGRWEIYSETRRFHHSGVSQVHSYPFWIVHIPSGDFWIALAYKHVSSHSRETARAMGRVAHLLLKILLRLHEWTRIRSSQENQDAIAEWRGMDCGETRLLDTYLRDGNQ